MWFVTNNIDLHSIELELMFINIRVLIVQYRAEIIFNSSQSERRNSLFGSTELAAQYHQ